MLAMRDGLPHRDVAAVTCDGAAVERGRGREAGVLIVARQGRGTRCTDGHVSLRVGRSGDADEGELRAHRLPSWCLLRTRMRMGRLTPLGIYLMSLVTDPIRGSHRLDSNTTSSATLISCPVNVKLLKNKYLSYDDPTVWGTARMADNA